MDIETLRFDAPVPYDEAYRKQIERRDAVQLARDPEAVFLLEHPPTITLGRNAHEHHLLQSRNALARLGIDVIDVDRGGDVTYHGPGQLVAYPILNIERRGLSIKGYLRRLEQVVIDTLATLDIDADRLDGYTGVWTGKGKIAAIGVGVHRGVTFHGVAINVAPDRTHWGLIVPCGIPDKPLSAIDQEIEAPPAIEQLMDAFEAVFRSAFAPNPA